MMRSLGGLILLCGVSVAFAADDWDPIEELDSASETESHNPLSTWYEPSTIRHITVDQRAFGYVFNDKGQMLHKRDLRLSLGRHPASQGDYRVAGLMGFTGTLSAIGGVALLIATSLDNGGPIGEDAALLGTGLIGTGIAFGIRSDAFFARAVSRYNAAFQASTDGSYRLALSSQF